ncbi:hypothetical protein CPY51_11465 [Rhizobium tubonense]|uniref:DUF2147 domain-containing protein n=2 Tax=Rhizobium tubonense TaxID=484088 RepID=A0A2W4DBT8_9HYPH|nr:DUF2147 domain-containing protein [Rhizobium tubonense]PZM14414.1 hypothetical protein CPY51_11465 [Rhizobium tubonense]
MRIFLLTAALFTFASTSHAADPIIGNWKTEVGTTAAIEPCGGGYCIVLRTGKHKGEQIGTFKGSGSSYSGKITDPDAKKTYDGKMTVSGNSIKMSGCVMRVFCQSQTWSRL